MAVAQYGSVPRFKKPEEIQEKVDQYFKECEGTLLRDHNGDPMLTKWGDPIYIDRKPPTVTGLALALGFKSRSGLRYYQGKKMFKDVILEAKSRVEQYVEEQLFTRDGAKGAQFSLRYNFKNWETESAKEEKKGPMVSIINDIPKDSTIQINTETAVFNPLKDPNEEDKAEDGAGNS